MHFRIFKWKSKKLKYAFGKEILKPACACSKNFQEGQTNESLGTLGFMS